MSRILFVATFVCAAIVPLACGGNVPQASPTVPPPSAPSTVAPITTPRPSPTSAPVATPASVTPAPTLPPSVPPDTFPPGSVIVTFAVGDEQFRVLVIDSANVAIANDLLAGEQAPSIPSGVVVRGDPGVNTGWSWHIDPATLEFADMTTEVCDGLPSFVEDGSITSDRFCPWGAEVVAVEPAN